MGLPVVQHYSDVLCIWAYVAHVRLEEATRKFDDKVDFAMHFVPVFPDAIGKLEKGWAGRGGIDAYGDHVEKVASGFPHVTLHADVWHKTRPKSSLAAHHFLKAVSLSEEAGIPLRDSNYYRATWALRQAFFAEGRDISDWQVQAAVAEELGLPLAPIEAQIRSGAAIAALGADTKLAEENKISGSPTFLMNAGRQILYGNVGYRLIEANLNELLRAPNSDEASWC
ncbi:MAG: DsbA family oxidoreductase [Marivivens sp.]